jgi:L-cysteine/cystine lyase
MTDPAAFRAEFPVLRRIAYLNAGSDGPVPRRAAQAAAEQTSTEVDAGRSGREHGDRVNGLRESMRSTVAELMGCDAGELALTHSTTDGVNTVLAGLDLPAGGEVLTTDEEHPGLLAPLAAFERRCELRVRAVPFDALAGEVGPDTRLIACSHVSWASGRVVDAGGLARSGVPVLLDGAQGLGAVPVDVRALGCDFYAASGQKWLCGPDGSGYLYVRRERIAHMPSPWPNFASLSEPARAEELPLHPDARRFDLGAVFGPSAAWARAALEVLGEAGWDWVLARGPALAEQLAAALAQRGLPVTPRGASTLVSWRQSDAARAVESLRAEGFVVRSLPGRGLVRASVGAWSSEHELEALADRAAAAG